MKIYKHQRESMNIYENRMDLRKSMKMHENLDDVEVTLVSHWSQIWVALKSFWGHLGITSRSCGDHHWVTLGSHWDHFGVTWDHCGVTLESPVDRVDDEDRNDEHHMYRKKFLSGYSFLKSKFRTSHVCVGLKIGSISTVMGMRLRVVCTAFENDAVPAHNSSVWFIAGITLLRR